jgi:hypothetical protein
MCPTDPAPVNQGVAIVAIACHRDFVLCSGAFHGNLGIRKALRRCQLDARHPSRRSSRRFPSLLLQCRQCRTRGLGRLPRAVRALRENYGLYLYGRSDLLILGISIQLDKEWPRLVGSIKVKFWLLAVCRNGSGGVADRGALRRAPGAGDHSDCCAR